MACSKPLAADARERSGECPLAGNRHRARRVDALRQPNALPFASKAGPVPGFQIELGEKIAEQLGVKLTREWVVSAIQYRRADCDLVLDVIARKDTEPAGGVRVSRPYHRSGVVLAVRSDSPAQSLASLGSDQRVGVPVGSLVSMTLAKGGAATSPFAFRLFAAER